MMQIYDGRDHFYQWDLNVKVTSDDFTVGEEIHFSNMRQAISPTVKTYELDGAVVADVPNIFLQTTYPLKVYRYVRGENSSQTIDERTFAIEQRPQPSDYFYTETELYALRNDVMRAVKEADENEENRRSAETTRGNAESERVANESTRKTNETNRVNAETVRANAETLRKNAESQRASAETVRVSAEGQRADAEQKRIEAENLRQANFESLPNNIGNAIKANASGEVIRVDDVSPIEHKVIIKVKGKNLYNLNNYNLDGSGRYRIKANGLEFGKVYTVFSELPIGFFKISTSYTGYNCAARVVDDGFTSFTFTLQQLGDVKDNSQLYFMIDNVDRTAIYDISILETMGICVVEGNTATEYEPYIDPTTVTVTRYGVNETDNPQTYVPSSDGICEIVALSPTMTLVTNNPKVTIELEYNQDTNKAMDDVKKDIRLLDDTLANLIGDTAIQSYVDEWLDAHYSSAEEVGF